MEKDNDTKTGADVANASTNFSGKSSAQCSADLEKRYKEYVATLTGMPKALHFFKQTIELKWAPDDERRIRKLLPGLLEISFMIYGIYEEALKINLESCNEKDLELIKIVRKLGAIKKDIEKVYYDKHFFQHRGLPDDELVQRLEGPMGRTIAVGEELVELLKSQSGDKNATIPGCDESKDILFWFSIDAIRSLTACNYLYKELENKPISVRDDLGGLLITMIEMKVDRKIAETDNVTGGPELNLREEFYMLQFLRAYYDHPRIQLLLAKINDALRRVPDVIEELVDLAKEGRPEKPSYMHGMGKFGLIINVYAQNEVAMKSEEIEMLVSDARKKLSLYIEHDHSGLPVVLPEHDFESQYAWADLNKYRVAFERASSGEERLKIFKRASVAELLRKLVNRDIGYGENMDARSTAVGLLNDHIDPENPDLFCKKIGSTDNQGAYSLHALMEPLEKALEPQSTGFLEILKQKFGMHEVYGPRIKPLESAILKMLKDGKDVSMDITDWIGFTILTMDENTAQTIFAEIRNMLKMDPKPIVYDITWTNPYPGTGRRSLDITGVPEGFERMMQVQCRTVEIDEKEVGMRSNHDAYKVRTGKRLLAQINGDPGRYLDQLYRAVHNLRCAFDEYRQNPGMNANQTVALYGKRYNEGLSIIRTTTLYK